MYRELGEYEQSLALFDKVIQLNIYDRDRLSYQGRGLVY